MLQISNLKLTPEQGGNIDKELNLLKVKTSKLLKVSMDSLVDFQITRKSIDARKVASVFYVYTVAFRMAENVYLKPGIAKEIESTEYVSQATHKASSNHPAPVVVGSGPAGLFAALTLAEAGLCPMVIERGKDVDARNADVDKFCKTGILNTESNIQFGEGGAGTFSDGKLNTGIRNPRISKIFKTFIECGAPDEIGYNAKPHIGTDILLPVIRTLREKIKSLGGTFYFETKLEELHIEKEKLVGITVSSATGTKEITTNSLILAIGHSARDTFEMLEKSGVNMTAKSFAVGVRIEHKQSTINKAQYKDFASKLPAADYKLAVKTKEGRGVYTFCMCPGGVVVPAASEEKRLVVNGMSKYARDNENANSAILVSVSPDDYKQFPGVLGGVAFQRAFEERAFNLGGGKYKAPVQLLGDFLKGKTSTSLGSVKPSYEIGYTLCNLRECLDDFVVDALHEGLQLMSKKIKGFDSRDAILTAAESRSSSPITILRDDNLNSNIKGILPCGEGGGHAGGIVSSAVDGIRCAESVIVNY